MQQDLVMMMADETSGNEYRVNDDDDYRSGKIKLFANQQHNDDISTDDYKDDELAFRQLHELNLKNKKPGQKAKCKTSHAQKSPSGGSNPMNFKLAKGSKAQFDATSDQAPSQPDALQGNKNDFPSQKLT